MPLAGKIALIVAIILLVALVVLVIVGRRLQKKQEASSGQMEAMAQTLSMLVIDKKMMKLSDSNGKLEMSNVEYAKHSLKSEDAFLIDRGDNIFIWVGNGASKNEKRFGLIYAKKYQNQEKRNFKYLFVIFISLNLSLFFIWRLR